MRIVIGENIFIIGFVTTDGVKALQSASSNNAGYCFTVRTGSEKHRIFDTCRTWDEVVGEVAKSLVSKDRVLVMGRRIKEEYRDKVTYTVIVEWLQALKDSVRIGQAMEEMGAVLGSIEESSDAVDAWAGQADG